MKKHSKVFFGLILIACLGNCVNDTHFTIPTIGYEENKALTKILDSIENSPNWHLISLSALKNQFISGNDPFQITSNLVVKGYVVSSDQNGNFFREFYLQDAPTNPTSGIKIVVNLTNSYNKFNTGREVYISLKDLYVGETRLGDGVTSIGGKLDNQEIDFISENQLERHLFRSKNTEIIEPLIITIPAINQNHVGLFISIEDAFFPKHITDKAYVDPNDDFDTQRIISACQGPSFVDFTLETSSFALFKNEILPSGSGTISGILTKTYSGNKMVLALNSTNDVAMQGAICTPSNLDEFTTILLDEDFEDKASGRINLLNWTNFNQEGSKFWTYEEDEDTLRRFAEIGSFSSRNDSTISWLITAPVNLEATTEEYISFETSSSFADGSDLEVLITNNWDGGTANILMANWEALPAIIVQDYDDFDLWTFSSYINLSSYSGNVYIAFKYIGSGKEEFDGTYEIDRIKIIAK
jgi:hypothetical protein